MERSWLIWAGLHGFCAVAMGAFAAHGLKERLDAQALGWVETASRYQLAHALALLGLAALAAKIPAEALKLSAWGFAFGALVFSGCLYAMALGGPRWLGAVTPLGGLLLLGGWLMLAISSSRSL